MKFVKVKLKSLVGKNEFYPDAATKVKKGRTREERCVYFLKVCIIYLLNASCQNFL